MLISYRKLDGWPTILIGMAVLGAGAFYVYQSYHRLELERQQLLAQIGALNEANVSLLKSIKDKEGTIAEFQGQIGDIANTIGTLEKLAQTDEELLKKYSKVYFLNENYNPPTLSDIDEQYVLKGSSNYYIHAKVWPYLRELFVAARQADIQLLSASAYRSFSTQASLKSAYTVTYGSGANQFSADQGYSEHQLGTTLDFTTTTLGNNFSAFKSTAAYIWLQNNAYKYGFILSYPEGNAYYKFEPWHWRFVGVALATYLHNEGKSFYDLDQREIDKYLVKLFE